MKMIKTLSLLAVIIAAGLGSVAFIKGQKAAPISTMYKGFAVVELFTSEGCSSCPPADAVIAKIEKEVTDKPVYILAYHVDYWNRLGWKDVFSSAEYSRRQSTFANWLNLSSVYTPQVIVNGRTEFVGSEESTLRNAINQNLNHPEKTALSLTDLKVNGNTALLKYNTSIAAGNNVMLLALIQKAATTVVKAGENDGRTLSHVQIVSNIQDVPLKATSGEASLKLPAGFSPKNFEVIAFVQNTQTGDISAATKITF